MQDLPSFFEQLAVRLQFTLEAKKNGERVTEKVTTPDHDDGEWDAMIRDLRLFIAAK